MSEADKRISDLLDRWSSSLELHARYLKLDDAEYAKAQAWPKHQRPNKWIVDLARQRVGELRHHLKERKEIGDDEFADALELMSFLTTLLASEHLERFVPLANPPKDATVRQTSIKPTTGTTATVRARAPDAPAKATAAPAVAAKSAVATAAPAKAAPKPTSPKSSSGRPVSARPAAPAQRSAAPQAKPPAPAARRAARAPARLSDQVTKLIISDAVRLLEWGSEWPQLASLIARLADRPGEKEVWSVLSEHRATIESRARARRT